MAGGSCPDSVVADDVDALPASEGAAEGPPRSQMFVTCAAHWNGLTRNTVRVSSAIAALVVNQRDFRSRLNTG